MSTNYEKKLLEQGLEYRMVSFFGDREKVQKLFNDLCKNKYTNEEYNPITSEEKIDPAIKFVCDDNNIKIKNVFNQVLYIQDIDGIDIVHKKACFGIHFFGGEFLPYTIFDDIVKKLGINYIDLAIAYGKFVFYSKDLINLTKYFKSTLINLEFETNEKECDMPILIENDYPDKNNVSCIGGIYKEKDYYCFYIDVGSDYHFNFEFLKEVMGINLSINIAFFLRNMGLGYTCFDKSNLFYNGKYMIDGAEEYYSDLGENSQEWLESKDIEISKYFKIFNSKRELIEETEFLTDKKIENDTSFKEIAEYISELNKKLYGDLVIFNVYRINKVKGFPYYLL